jgi:hypothetical protein
MPTKVNLLKLWDSKHHFSELNLPALIHYKSWEGGSNYSMVLIENLILQWSKVILITWYQAAKDKLFEEIKAIAKNIVIVKSISDVKRFKNKQVIIINESDEKLCLQAIKTLEDINERIIFIKNIDIFQKPLLTQCLKYKKIILSWDLDTCTSTEAILKKRFTSILLFSQPKAKISYKFVPLEKYIWYIRSTNKEWYIKSM